MSGKKETVLEKILKPVRINPVTLGIAVAGLGSYYLTGDSENPVIETAKFLEDGVGGFFLGCYMWGVKNYFRDRRILKERGFDERHGELRMEHYCDRQAFNVAGIENGYRDEVTDLIQRTPREEKKFWYLPHI